MSDAPEAWPDDDQDPFATSDEPLEQRDETPPIEDNKSKTTDEPQEESVADEQSTAIEQWTLPVRVAPVMAISGEEVKEFPLNESVDGRRNTSLIVSDNLIRIIQVTYDDDGQRRLNVKTVLKNELTGFTHTHNELMHKHQWMWVSAIFAGLVATFIPFLGFFGQFILAGGLIGWAYMHLEVHTLEFSTSGSKHRVHFTGYGSNRPMFRASMALIGPTIAKYMDTGEFDTQSITTFHDSLAKPVVQEMPTIVMADDGTLEALPSQITPSPELPAPPEAPTPSVETLAPLVPPAPPINIPQPVAMQIPEPPAMAGPPASTPPQPLTAPPPPPAVTTAPPPPPLPPPLPPATMPPPLPMGGMIPPMPMDMGEVPLDAPMPAAPEINVPAAPVEESLSDDEKNELLEELK
ncbi:MAG: hypothetical protein ISP82_01830 [Candidatus Poseidoniaceae archaeon]|nr:hypothetical protein [Candidatus Poseidoniaceae archaeon]MBL6896692.1 hypothetical protein [Candidatus Poseidoniaceae archaeon]